MAYAENTSVSVERSQGELKAMMGRYGAEAFGLMEEGGGSRALVEFIIEPEEGRRLRVRFVLTMPDREEYRATPSGKKRRDNDATWRAWEQACRSRWRALVLVCKAKLEAVDAGISTFEQEFLPHLVTASGETIGQRLLPDLQRSLAKGSGLRLLPAAGGA